ncbi:acyl carrier protein [Streptomyces silvensis]|uniref:Acyl carrier protein n=1 Tax=Streptomyces silvensis TaxID=1765722 RepID=A0A0W7X1B3_9ACTN|nr:acyl carrier protein [Streptomyces silvensis]KUF16617.1 acyl carrier protein [Streptomyces silvensis]
MGTPNKADVLTAPVVTKELSEFLTANLGQELALDDDYFTLGLVNSLFAMELVTFVERQYAIEVQVDDLDLDNFRTLGRLRDFVLAKTAHRGAAA